MMRTIREIRSDYVDDENNLSIDIWFSDDENAQGMQIAQVCLNTGKVFIQNEPMSNKLTKEDRELVREEIKDFKEKHPHP